MTTVDYSNFIILLARQRSGTNALRSILETHPDVFCFNEVFNFADRNSERPLLRQTNFFNFMVSYANGDVRRLFPDQHEALFLAFLDYLRCFTSKRYLIIDVKYNMTHIFGKPWASIASPYLFELIRTHQLGLLRITRKHYLRFVLSVLKAWRSGCYQVGTRDATYSDRTISISPTSLWGELEQCRIEDLIIEKRFASHERSFVWEYADLFSNDTGQASDEFLHQFSSWLGIPNTFANQSSFRKQAALPLHETIENYDEIARTIRGTEFEYCLEDEVMYRQVPASSNGSLPASHRDGSMV